MHMASEPPPLGERCEAPAALCDLIHHMLDKDPSLRPVALEIRQLARAIALVLAPAAYEALELFREARPAAARIYPPRAFEASSNEVVVVDPEALELGITELLPIVRKPRWTPEIGPIPGPLAARSDASRAPARGASEDDLGEIVLLHQRRRPAS
jgi:hypothetical protein